MFFEGFEGARDSSVARSGFSIECEGCVGERTIRTTFSAESMERSRRIWDGREDSFGD